MASTPVDDCETPPLGPPTGTRRLLSQIGALCKRSDIRAGKMQGYFIIISLWRQEGYVGNSNISRTPRVMLHKKRRADAFRATRVVYRVRRRMGEGADLPTSDFKAAMWSPCLPFPPVCLAGRPSASPRGHPRCYPSRATAEVGRAPGAGHRSAQKSRRTPPHHARPSDRAWCQSDCGRCRGGTGRARDARPARCALGRPRCTASRRRCYRRRSAPPPGPCGDARGRAAPPARPQAASSTPRA